MTQDADFLKTTNDSGFPLQIAVEHQVRDTTASHGWRVRYIEHSWINRQDGQSGFIDLVLEDKHGTTFLVIECKRVRDATWLFLPSDGADKKRNHSKAWISHQSDGVMKSFDWGDIAIEPSCHEALFCATRGQSTNDKRTMLERIGGELISATEALAWEERNLQLQGRASIWIYFNLVVTTADLKVAKFSPKDISLFDGTLASADFEDVPFVRFRKQMALRETLLPLDDDKKKKGVSYSKENTVFIVRADKLLHFLSQFEIPEDNLRHIQYN
ncbi:MAG: hypothetical protein Q7S51_00080 [Gallionellaceae bacterium]|nr:hypothetical protein [Gallionellaceae bacterium]